MQSLRFMETPKITNHFKMEYIEFENRLQIPFQVLVGKKKYNNNNYSETHNLQKVKIYVKRLLN